MVGVFQRLSWSSSECGRGMVGRGYQTNGDTPMLLTGHADGPVVAKKQSTKYKTQDELSDPGGALGYFGSHWTASMTTKPSVPLFVMTTAAALPVVNSKVPREIKEPSMGGAFFSFTVMVVSPPA